MARQDLDEDRPGSAGRGRRWAKLIVAGGDDPELASYLRIEERELEAGGLN
jgi:hypothetical protein